MLTRALPLGLSLWLFTLTGNAQAPAPIPLQASQAASLGIVVQPVGEEAGGALERLPARVVVPQKFLRHITAPLEGHIDMLAVVPGDTVRKGQVLATLRSPQALAWQAAGQTALAQSQLAQETLKRDELLFAEGLIPESRLSASRTAAAQAGARAMEQQLGLAAAGIRLGKMSALITLTAPMDGTILAQDAQVGQRVDAAASLYRMGDLRHLALEIQAPLALAEQLRPGSTIPLLTPPGQARLTAIGRAVDPASQSVQLHAEVVAGQARLTPGQLLEVQVENPRAGGARIPATALIRQGKQSLVFVQDKGDSPDGLRYTARPVDILSQAGQTVAVRGLRPGEAVVTQGASGLKALLQAQGRE